MKLELICQRQEEMIPKGIIGIGKSIKEAFQNAELALEKLCDEKGYKLILYGRGNRVKKKYGYCYIERDAKFVKIPR